ncbi:hypothetical protein G9C85_02585 [Halorubellus sp. JP-L1]|uniref:hypothetical protein n=1 Tax=Halorubellus sp. JP-L1 TaxID=2715753 RepID=UPI00140AB99D|nr:hypothetical protein [Halorubellus sp. JP-L1]NHN40525.1 hypothetical protein [Halorubellus sp. JP-L1]
MPAHLPEYEMSAATRDQLASDLREATDGVDNDIMYLLELVADSLENESAFESDRQRLQWAVSQLCQETDFVPVLDKVAATDEISPGCQEVREL